MRPVAAFLFLLAACTGAPPAPAAPLRIGVAEVDITPPEAYPMAGYYHERLNTGVRDRLHAKALAFVQGDQRFVLVMCDLVHITSWLSQSARKKAALPDEVLVVAATHTHTGPDYKSDVHQYADRGYPAQLSAAIAKAATDALADALQNEKESSLSVGSGTQEDPIAFCRRFVLKDGSVRTWANYKDPNVIREANPIDSQVSLLRVGSRALLVNFALHPDTLSGTLYSADFPHALGEALKDEAALTIFANGCCGNINHVNPRAEKRRPTDEIGRSLADTVKRTLPSLTPVTTPRLAVRRSVVGARLRKAENPDAARAMLAQKGPIDKYDQIRAVTQLSLEDLNKAGPVWPLEVHAVRLDDTTAIVTLPGEIFVELGLAIKKRSPFKTTFIVELANASPAYIPTRKAFAVGGYEVLNSRLEPGEGERLVEAAVSLLEDLR